jgi:hypothetical protein
MELINHHLIWFSCLLCFRWTPGITLMIILLIRHVMRGSYVLLTGIPVSLSHFFSPVFRACDSSSCFLANSLHVLVRKYFMEYVLGILFCYPNFLYIRYLPTTLTDSCVGFERKIEWNLTEKIMTATILILHAGEHRYFHRKMQH